MNGTPATIDAGTGWADPDSGFTVEAEPVINTKNDGEIYSFHSGGAQVCFADGSARFLSDSLDSIVAIALVTRGWWRDHSGRQIVTGNPRLAFGCHPLIKRLRSMVESTLSNSSAASRAGMAPRGNVDWGRALLISRSQWQLA